MSDKKKKATEEESKKDSDDCLAPETFKVYPGTPDCPLKKMEFTLTGDLDTDLASLKSKYPSYQALPERKFVELEDKRGALKDYEVAEQTFRICQFNMLADALSGSYFSNPSANPSAFLDTPAECLKWSYRGLKIVQVILQFEADIICIEECDCPQFISDYLSPQYSCHFMSKGGGSIAEVAAQVTKDRKLATPLEFEPDGFFIAFKSAKFRLISKQKIEKSMTRSGAAAMALRLVTTRNRPTEEEEPLELIPTVSGSTKDLLAEATPAGDDAKGDSKKPKGYHHSTESEFDTNEILDDRFEFVLVSTHLKSKKTQEGEQMRLDQLTELFTMDYSSTAAVDNPRNTPIICCADLNATPTAGDGGYEPLTYRKLVGPVTLRDESKAAEYTAEPMMKSKKKAVMSKKKKAAPVSASVSSSLTAATPEELGLGFTSAMADALGGEPEYTTHKKRAKGVAKHTIDYIFHRDGYYRGLNVTGYAEISGEFGKKTLPNFAYPSDHIALTVDYTWSVIPPSDSVAAQKLQFDQDGNPETWPLPGQIWSHIEQTGDWRRDLAQLKAAYGHKFVDFIPRKMVTCMSGAAGDSALKSPSKFTICQFNMLADGLTGGYIKINDDKSFLDVDKECLRLQFRGLRLLEAALSSDPDILAIQECDVPGFFAKYLEQSGYSWKWQEKFNSPIFRKVSKRIAKFRDWPPLKDPFPMANDGLLLAWKNDKFEKLKTMRLNSNETESGVTALCVRLRHKTLMVTRSGDAIKGTAAEGSGATKKPLEFLYVNTHLKSTKEKAGEVIRVAQMKELFELIPNEDNIPVIVSCDLNANPVRNKKGYDPWCYEAITAKLGSSTTNGDIGHGYSSIYKVAGKDEPEYTTWKLRKHGTDKHTIDFIFMRFGKWRVIRYLDIPRTEDSSAKFLIPSWRYPSDHFPLVFDVDWDDSMANEKETMHFTLLRYETLKQSVSELKRKQRSSLESNTRSFVSNEHDDCKQEACAERDITGAAECRSIIHDFHRSLTEMHEKHHLERTLRSMVDRSVRHLEVDLIDLLDGCNQRNDALSAQVRGLKETIQVLTESKDRLINENDECQSEIRNLKQQMSEVKREHSNELKLLTDAHQKDMGVLNEQFNAKFTQLSELSNRITQDERSIKESLETRIESFKQEIQQLKSDADIRQLNHSRLVEQLNSDKKELLRKIQERDEEIAMHKSEMVSLSKRYSELEQSSQSRVAELTRELIHDRKQYQSRVDDCEKQLKRCELILQRTEVKHQRELKVYKEKLEFLTHL